MDLTTWSHYIRAQNSLLNKLCKPFALLPVSEKINNKGILKVEIDRGIYQKELINLIKGYFPSIIEDEINLEKGYFLIDNDKIPNSEKLEKFKIEAEKFYLEFMPFPALEGFITDNTSPFSILKQKLKESEIDLEINSDGDVLLPIKGIEIFDKIKNISRKPEIGAIFQVKIPYDLHFRNNIVALFNQIGLNNEEDYRLSNSSYNIYCSRMIFTKEQFVQLGKDIDLKISAETLRVYLKKKFSLENIECDVNGEYYIDTKSSANQIKFEGEKLSTEEFFLLSYHSLVLQIGIGNIIRIEKRFVFSYNPNTPFFDNINSLRLNEERWSEIRQKLGHEIYYCNTLKNTISFDFTNANDFENKLEKINQIDWIELGTYGENHKFKVTPILLNDSFNNLQEQLIKKFGKKNLRFKKIDNNRKLRVRYSYQLNDERDNKLAFLNFFSTQKNDAFSLKVDKQFKIKFTFEINEALKEFEENTKFNKIRGAEITLNNQTLGILRRASFPFLELQIHQDKIEEVNELLENNDNALNKIKPILAGDVEKIFRLEDTLKKINSKDEKIVNPNLVDFLFDSSKARANNENIFQQESTEWQKLIQNCLSNNLNNAQIEAVLKTLEAEDLAIIQGPPGTGKSTAISEIIWQHILRNAQRKAEKDERGKEKYKILLTSETNLAVDNAMEKLIASNTNLVKPIRIGSDEKLEDEGARFLLKRITNWVEGHSLEDNTRDNIIVKWIDNISRKSKERTIVENNEPLIHLLSKWQNYLNDPTRQIRRLFADTYIDNANVIGATCSSIAEVTSANKRSSFAWGYHSIFNRQSIEDMKNEQEKEKNNRSEYYWSATNKIRESKLEFDVVIMDEASKATPPEFALPLLYGKKSIIIGDHRQLPPMLDENDFATTLDMIGEKELAKEFRKADHNISHFEKLFLNPNINPNIKASFDTQFRMHSQINDVIKQFYIKDNGLKCGLDPIQVNDNNLGNPQSRYHGLKYDGFIDPNTHVIWVDVDTPEILEGTSRVNFGEVDACRKVLNYLYHSEGFNSFQNFWAKPEDKEIGLISFYGRQLFYLDKMANEFENKIPIRIRTVDRFQGMERNILMVSMVRSNCIASDKEQEADYDNYPILGFPKQNSLGFAEFPNRLNVALSRAKRLLIIVGNSAHFCQHEIYKNVYQIIQNSDFDRIIKYKDLKDF